MAHVQPFVAIVLGEGSQQDAEGLARAAGATAILRPGQPHPIPLHAPDAVIDLAAPEHDGGREEPVLDLVPAQEHADEVIDLIAPDHSAQPAPESLPGTAVVIDPAEVLDVRALVAAVHQVLDGLKQLEATAPDGCVVASRTVTDTLKLVDAGVLLGTARRDEHRWVSAPLAGPLTLLTELAAIEPAPAADREGSPSVRPMLEVLLRRGVEVRTVPI